MFDTTQVSISVVDRRSSGCVLYVKALETVTMTSAAEGECISACPFKSTGTDDLYICRHSTTVAHGLVTSIGLTGVGAWSTTHGMAHDVQCDAAVLPRRLGL